MNIVMKRSPIVDIDDRNYEKYQGTVVNSLLLKL
ncbi:hypothetical protein J2Y02_001221 [Neobacillus drentensis]|nr:hypothetical protein [Neobacillus drentensis]